MRKHLGIVVSLFLIYFVFAALLNSVGILVERSQTVYHISKMGSSFLEPFKDITIAVVSFLVGSFLPRIGFKRGMLLSLGFVFIGCFIMYFGNSFNTVKLLFAITGMSFAIVKVAVFSLIGYVTDTKKDHSQLMSLLETVFMLGIIFMYVVFPLFYSDDNPNAWLNGYLIMAILIGVAFVIIAFTKFNLEDQQEPTTIKKDFMNMLNLFQSNYVVWVFAVFAFFYVMTEQGISSWLPTFNKDTLHIDSKLSSQVAVILFISTALGRFIASFLVKKIKWFYICSVSIILAGILVLIVLPMAENIPPQKITKVRDLPMVSFIFPLIGLFLAPIYPLVNSTVLSSVAKSKHSSLAGILTFFSAIGGTVGSIAIGNLFDLLGGNKVFYLSLIPMAIILGSLFLLNKSVKDES